MGNVRPTAPAVWLDARTIHSEFRTPHCLLQLPDLHSVSREVRDQYTLPLAVVSDVGRAGHARNHLHFLSRLVARHGRVSPARDEHPTPRHLDAVRAATDLGDHARR